MAQLVKDFIRDSYQLVSASSPNVPLHGNDSAKGLQFLNELLNYYSSTGLLLPIPVKIEFNIPAGQPTITFGTGGSFDVTTGRLAQIDAAWLNREGVDYPLAQMNRYEFYNSYKFAPLQALPLYFYVEQQIDSTNMTLYPKPDTGYLVSISAKQQFRDLTENDDMSIVPEFYIRFLRYALAQDIAMYKGRAEAWTPQLERIYIEAKKKIEGAGEINLNIDLISDIQLNGAQRVRAGI